MKNNKGITLLEIIIALAIISILVFSFVTLFSSNLITIFGMGNKTEAVNLAQDIIDNEDFSALVEYDDYTTMISDEYDDSVDMNGRYCIEEDALGPELGSLSEGSGDVVVVMIFYNNGSNYVTLSSYYE